jgi:hypothetical protein
MSQKRHKGFVVAVDEVSGRPVWKVRVKDPTSSYHGEKLVVASIHGSVQLARGLNVHFLIGTVDDEQGKNVLRAVDVRIEVATN